jgi:sigma-B regulation protein RsbU (phosphoserine phosphatase)
LEVMEIVRRKPDLVNEIQREMQAWVTDFQGELISKLNEKNQELKRINEELKTTQKANLDVQEMERELQFARQIQKGILPRKLPQIPGFDFGVLMAQARHVGGDFFDFIPLGRDSIGIAIGDVSDKGVPASLFMAVTRSLLRAEAHLGLHPSQVLQRVNYHLMDMNEAGLFVTMVYGVLNVIEKTFSYARAGHEIPLFFTEEYTYECVDYEHGQALGIFHQPVFDENEIRFSKDSFLLLNTDGITDAINETGNAFGIDQLKNVISTNISSSAQSICDRVAKAVTDFAGTSPQFDDLTLVGIKCK